MRNLIIYLFILISTIVKSQEICNNGIDDDNDGLIDLNDYVDCPCSSSTQGSNNNSLFPNPSFETNTCCPSNSGAIGCTGNWKNGVSSSSDYFNTCGFIGYMQAAGLLPFPDGNGAVGGIISDGYVEDIGSCLTTPLQAGVNYKVKLNIASMLISGLDTNVSQIPYGPIDITVFGNNACGVFPPSGGGQGDCPSNVDPSWVVLGSTTYTPGMTWSIITITFTPASSINAIIIGGPCSVPSSYISPFSSFYAPYFCYDNCLLSPISPSEPPTANVTGNYCNNDLVLNATGSNTSSVQWYNNGVAIVGANSISYSVASVPNNIGIYQAVQNNGSQCLMSNTVSVQNIMTSTLSISPSYTVITNGDNVMINTNSTSNTFTWSPSNNLSCINCVNPIASPSITTIYCLYEKQNICLAKSCTTIEVESSCLSNNQTIPNAFTPNGDGKNDEFCLQGLAGCISQFSISIYDRWGEKVFESRDPTFCWDGSYKGKVLDPAVFVYYIKAFFNNKNITKKGNISLIR